MLRYLLLLAVLPALSSAAWAAAPRPLMYDLIINGETFTVAANRAVKLKSRTQPGTTYDVALRVAQIQRLPLNHVQFDYDLGFEVSDDEATDIRTVTLQHELGFSMLVTDMGQALTVDSQEQILNSLSESMQQQFRGEDALELEVSQARARKFSSAGGRQITITYGDAEGLGHTCQIYLLAGKTFTASCIVHYLDGDAEDVLPLVERTLDTLQAK